MIRRSAAHLIRRLDRRIRTWTGRRRVLVYVRTSMHAGVLEPIARGLERDPRLDVRYLSERAVKRGEIEQAVGRPLSWVSTKHVAWARIDLLMTADPWTAPTMHRSFRRVNFFHGVAGKYNLDDPSHLPIGFDEYDRVGFVNADRMGRYLEKGIVRRDAAVLVGFPKIDGLVNGRYDSPAIRERLGLEMHRPTAIYAPTWSPASSLHVAGDRIVESLVDAGGNVIVKPHARSFDPDPQYSGGGDSRGRPRGGGEPGRG